MSRPIPTHRIARPRRGLTAALALTVAALSGCTTSVTKENLSVDGKTYIVEKKVQPSSLYDDVSYSLTVNGQYVSCIGHVFGCIEQVRAINSRPAPAPQPTAPARPATSTQTPAPTTTPPPFDGAD
ncbi:MAG: hypothetical protein R3D85_06085 [Paracoccaceae bacterium]